MTALIKKDMFLLGKQTWLILGIAVIFSLSPHTAMFGSAYLSVLTLTLPLTVLAYEERCSWDRFMALTPCPPGKIVLSKYLFTYGLAVLAVLTTLVTSWVSAKISGGSYDFVENLISRAAVLIMMLFALAVVLPSAYRFGVEKGRYIMIGICFGTFGLIAGGVKLLGADKINEMFGWLEELPLPLLGAVLAVVLVIVHILSVIISVRFYINRRTGAYD